MQDGSCDPGDVDPITLEPPRHPLPMRCVTATGGVSTLCFDIGSLMQLLTRHVAREGASPTSDLVTPLLNPLNRQPFTERQITRLRLAFNALPALDRASIILDTMREVSQPNLDIRVFIHTSVGDPSAVAVEWRYYPEDNVFERSLFEWEQGEWTPTGLVIPMPADVAGALANDLASPDWVADLIVVRPWSQQRYFGFWF